jgi:hypothetical protein
VLLPLLGGLDESFVTLTLFVDEGDHEWVNDRVSQVHHVMFDPDRRTSHAAIVDPGLFLDDNHDTCGVLQSDVVVFVDHTTRIPRAVAEKAHESFGVGKLEGGSSKVVLNFVADLTTSLFKGSRLAVDVDDGVVVDADTAGGSTQSAAVFDDVDTALGDRVGGSSIQNKFVDLAADLYGNAEKERFHVVGSCL